MKLDLDLPYADQQPRRALPKHATPSRLDAKTAKDKADKAAEKTWKAAVWQRDKGKCRYSGLKVKAMLALDPRRGERHHIAGRADRAVRWDRRNGILLSLAVHEQVERNELRIVGTKFFVVDGKTYINADQRVRFEMVK